MYIFYAIEIVKCSQVNGVVTLKENIADSVAVAAAYYAFKDRKARLRNHEWRLPDLEQYSDEQMFFLTYAQVSN